MKKYASMITKRRLKPAHKTAVRATISFPPTLFEAARTRLANGGYSGVSDYLQALVRKDTGLDQIRVEIRAQ